MAFTYTDITLPLSVPIELIEQVQKMTLTINGVNEIFENLEITSSMIDTENGYIYFPLTQEMTGKLQGCNTIQINYWVDGKRDATTKAQFHLDDNELQEVIHNE